MKNHVQALSKNAFFPITGGNTYLQTLDSVWKIIMKEISKWNRIRKFYGEKVYYDSVHYRRRDL